MAGKLILRIPGRDEQSRDIGSVLDAGVPTSATGSGSFLTDTSKRWGINIWAGKLCRVIGGLADGNVRRILTNTATILYFDDPMLDGDGSPVASSPGSAYQILDDSRPQFNGFSALASEATTQTTRTSGVLGNGGYGLVIQVNIASYTNPGAPGAVLSFTPSLQILLPDGSTYYTIWTAAAAITANGNYVYEFHEGAVSGSGYTEALNELIPPGFFKVVLTVTNGDAANHATTQVDYTSLP